LPNDHVALPSGDERTPGGSRQPLIRPERYAFFDKLLFAMFVLCVPPMLASNWSVFRDGDVSWHVAAGRWILEHRTVPATDPFSFTMAGHPWVAFEWGAEIIYAIAYGVGGFGGLAAVVAAALMALFVILFLYLRTKVGPIALLVTFAGICLVLQPFIMARPHVIGWPFLAAWSALLLKYRDEGRSPPLPLALLMLAWANIHGSYFAGFIVAAAVGLDAAIAARWERETVLKWLVFGSVSFLATLLNANGIAGLLHPLTISGMSTLPALGEWHPSTPRATPLFYFLLLACTGALLWKRPEFRVGEILLLLIALAMAFTHIRHQSVFIIIGAIVVAPKLAGPGRGDAGPLFATPFERRLWIASAIGAAVAILAVRAMVPLQPRETFSNPRGLIAHIPPELRAQPVLNEYSMGGPLILAGVRPFIDGRADMYGDAFFSDYLKITDGDWPTFKRAVGKYRIRWTMLQNDNRLVPKLDASPDWKRVYSDKVGVIHVRRSAPALPDDGAQHEDRR
jgi:hypothetical protein